MWVWIAFALSWTILGVLWFLGRIGRPTPNRGDFMGMAGFWAVVSSAAVIARALF